MRRSPKSRRASISSSTEHTFDDLVPAFLGRLSSSTKAARCMEVVASEEPAPTDLFEALDAAAAAEPMDPEDDLILRMEQSAKVHGGGRGGAASKSFAKEKRAQKALQKGGVSSRGGIGKQRRQPKKGGGPEGMKVDHSSTCRPSSRAVAAAAAVVADGLPMKLSPLKLKRSHSI